MCISACSAVVVVTHRAKMKNKKPSYVDHRTSTFSSSVLRKNDGWMDMVASFAIGKRFAAARILPTMTVAKKIKCQP
jgi:hypothetical protein